MSTFSARTRPEPVEFHQGLLAAGRRLWARLPMSRGALFGLIIVGGLIGFEVFNYSTTEFALADLLGPQQFAGLRWATILALAFCAIDFAGIARLFTPEGGRQEPAEVWYLLGAWFLAATMNAMLTWWGVSLALLSHEGLGNEILGREALLSSVPVFVAVLVWLIRVLMIGTLTLGGERLFGQDRAPSAPRIRRIPAGARALGTETPVPSVPSAPRPMHAAPKPVGPPNSSVPVRTLSARPPSRR
jgi:hypothetical protein